MMLAGFALPLGDGFVATARLGGGYGGASRGVKLLDPTLSVGVGFDPLRALRRSLGLWPDVAVLEIEVAGLGHANNAVSDRPLSATPGESADGVGRLPRIQGSEDVVVCAERASELVLGRAVSFAEPLASVDALSIALRKRSSSSDHPIEAAFLVAAGRFDEARDALARWEPPRRTGTQFIDRARERAHRRTIYQLGRLIAARGDLELPAPSTAKWSNGTKRSERLGDRLSVIRAREDAVANVRRLVPGQDRDAAREALTQALTARGVTENPRWIEAALDELSDRATVRRRTLTDSAKAILDAALSKAPEPAPLFYGLIKGTPHSVVEVPQTLEPPEPAFYPLPETGRWIATRLDHDANEWLAENCADGHGALAGHLGLIDVWLRWDTDEDDGPPQLAVHLGERRLGTIPDHGLRAFVGPVEEASRRAELVVAPARITHRDRDPRWLVEIATPIAEPTSAGV